MGGWGAAGKSYEVYLGKISKTHRQSKFPASLLFCQGRSSLKLAAAKGLVGVAGALLRTRGGRARFVKDGFPN